MNPTIAIIGSGFGMYCLLPAFYNTKQYDITISQGTRLVQICMPNLSYDFNVKLVDSLDETERGEGGLGSTGE